jgi:hypothetical protein
MLKKVCPRCYLFIYTHSFIHRIFNIFCECLKRRPVMKERASFLKFLEVLVNEDERTRVFKEFVEHKTNYSVFLEKISIPGITDSFEIHNIKLTSPDKKVRINAETLKLTSTQLSSLIAAGKIILNSTSEIPIENVEGHGVFVSLGPEDKPVFECFSSRAIFRGIEFKIKYDTATGEPEFTGTLSSKEIATEISAHYGGVEVPTVAGDADLTFNLKTLTGKADIRISGKKEIKNAEEKRGHKERKKEQVSMDDMSLTLSFEFTLFPYSV